jgi:hypothetical protein
MELAPQSLDQDLTTARAFGVGQQLPQTFIRPDGTVAYRTYGRLDDKLVRQGLWATRTTA